VSARRILAGGAGAVALAMLGTLAAQRTPAAPGPGAEAPSAAQAPTAAAPASAPLALHGCRLQGLTHDALCGTLRRPLDPARPAGPQIDLQVAVLPAIARQKLPDPVFFFAGGPGQSAIALAGAVDHLLSRIGGRRDIVLIDQRGTGHSAPLQCDAPSADEALARALDRARLASAMQACRTALQKLPWGDLRLFTTTIAMADADAVRAALGAERIDLIGGSYGTRAALEYLRLYPQHVRRVVLDGVAPPDMVLPESFNVDGRAALDGTFRACAQEPACARAHPALGQTWQRLLDATPQIVDIAEPASGRPLRVTFTRAALEDLVRPALYRPAVGAVLPFAIEEAAAGRFGTLLALGASGGPASPIELSEGEHFAVVCAEDAPRLSAAPLPGDAGFDAVYRSVCADWPRADVPAAFYTIPPSAAPVLLLSGGADPVTPPRHAARVAQALGPRARHVVVPNSGHGVLSLPCIGDAIFHFVSDEADDAALAVDAQCATRVPRPLAYQALLPQRAASAPNDPHGFGDESPQTPLPPPRQEPPPAPRPAPDDKEPSR
jgi:pimeloyl-ACP methyl ester carboxylesterase